MSVGFPNLYRYRRRSSNYLHGSPSLCVPISSLRPKNTPLPLPRAPFLLCRVVWVQRSLSAHTPVPQIRVLRTPHALSSTSSLSTLILVGNTQLVDFGTGRPTQLQHHSSQLAYLAGPLSYRSLMLRFTCASPLSTPYTRLSSHCHFLTPLLHANARLSADPGCTFAFCHAVCMMLSSIRVTPSFFALQAHLFTPPQAHSRQSGDRNHTRSIVRDGTTTFQANKNVFGSTRCHLT